MRERIKKVNTELFKMKYTVDKILKFWSDCINEAKNSNQTRLL